MKKNPILFNHILKSSIKSDKIVIGIIGTHHGAGVTHSGIMLSNYLDKYKGVKTAYLEMNHEDELKFLNYAYEGIPDDQEEKKEFVIHNTTYYENVREQDFIQLINLNYQYFILDFGTDYKKDNNEFLRCDIKIVIGSLTEWKRQYLFQFIDSKRQLPGFASWRFLIVFGQKNDLRMASRELHMKLDYIEFEPDPFLLSKESVKLFQRLLF